MTKINWMSIKKKCKSNEIWQLTCYFSVGKLTGTDCDHSKLKRACPVWGGAGMGRAAVIVKLQKWLIYGKTNTIL